MPRYYIIDLSVSYEDGLPENGWFIDGEGNIVYEFESPNKFVESFLYNIEYAKDFDGVDEVQKWSELIEDNYTEVNGFGYSIEN